MSLSKQQTLAVHHLVSTNKADNTSSKYLYIQNTLCEAKHPLLI